VIQGLRRRFWAEVAALIASALLFLLTLARPDGIEALFEVEPDGGSGELEWILVAVLLTSTLAFSSLAWRERRRAASDAGQRGW
jgi:hypothetical protein